MNKTTAQNALNALKEFVCAINYQAPDAGDRVAQAEIDAKLAIAELEAVIAQPVEPYGYVRRSDDKFFPHPGGAIYASFEPSLIHVYAEPQEPEAPVAGFTGISVEADFSTDIWSFKMDPGYKVGAGQYLITRIQKAPGEPT